MDASITLIQLREITADTVRKVTRLSVREDQRHLVATVAESLAEALFAREAWYRVICHGEEMVGFVMLYDESLRSPAPQAPQVGVWRFMIDARFQGKGFGREALLRVVDHVRSKKLFSKLELSYVPGPQSPESFYLGLGFQPNGKVEGGEIVLELPLGESAA